MMRQSFVTVAVLLLLALPAGAQAPLEALSRLVGGEWVARGAQLKPGGTRLLDAVVRYEWAEDRRSIRSQSFLVEEGERQLQFESTLRWEAEGQQIRFRGSSATGEVVEGGVQARAGLIEFTWQAQGTSYRQVLRFAGDDEHRLTAFEGVGEGSKQLQAMTFIRRHDEP